MADIDARLKEWATPRQAAYVDAIQKHGSHRKAAKALDVSHAAIDHSISALKKSAAVRGYSPDHGMTQIVPAPFVVKGTSTLYGKNGEQKLQWVKTKLDGELLEQAVREAIAALSEDMPRLPAVDAPDGVQAHLASLYTLTDTHIGCKAWAAECGEDWDLEIAERTLSSAFLHLIQSSPVASIGIVNFLGDIQHYDSLDAVTPQHRNLLDADSRFPKMVQVTVRILRRVVDAALLRHAKVIVSFQEGNHDMASSVWLRHLFGLLYENEPRCEVLNTLTPYSVIRHGETLLAFHHGHMSKNQALPLLFAAQFPKEWGATTRRYCHTGHRHHVEEKEHSGMIVIQHPTIAARDAYAARGGWIADRSATAITYHDRFGQVVRVTVTPDMF